MAEEFDIKLNFVPSTSGGITSGMATKGRAMDPENTVRRSNFHLNDISKALSKSYPFHIPIIRRGIWNDIIGSYGLWMSLYFKQYRTYV